MSEKDFTRIGCKVVALTKHPGDLISFDAHYRAKKRVIRGKAMPTPEAALTDLYTRCLEVVR